MNPKRWLYIKNLRPSAGRMVHTSAEARMIRMPDPNGVLQVLPWTQRPGVTLRLGRNAAKRERRAARLIQRHG